MQEEHPKITVVIDRDIGKMYIDISGYEVEIIFEWKDSYWCKKEFVFYESEGGGVLRHESPAIEIGMATSEVTHNIPIH